MDVLPIFVRVSGRRCLVVGGGPVAAGKVDVLVKARASVRVVAPTVDERLEECAARGDIDVHRERFRPEHLDDCWLVVAATDDEALNEEITVLAEARGMLANAASNGTLGNFIMPAIIDRHPVIAAVSTGGKSPVLARFIRARLETLIPRGFGDLATLAGQFRDRVKSSIGRQSDRRAFWDRVFSGPIAERVFAGQHDQAQRMMLDALQTPQENTGEVYLVGAGPGDPDLLSFRAMRLIQQADTVVYDRLVSPGVMELVRRDAEKIYAGKRRADHAIAQEDINRLLVRLAREGKRVLRLKGGDPFIFGRGGEEIAELAEQGIPFQVVPGITAASGCAAYAGIPLTHRDHAHACVFVTGNLRDGEVNLDWASLARPLQTIVVYMGLVGLDQICAELVAHGMDPTTPAAIIEQGTTAGQRVLVGTVATLPAEVERQGAKAPTLVIIGSVVSLRDRLDWFQVEGEQHAHRTLAHSADVGGDAGHGRASGDGTPVDASAADPPVVDQAAARSPAR